MLLDFWSLVCESKHRGEGVSSLFDGHGDGDVTYLGGRLPV